MRADWAGIAVGMVAAVGAAIGLATTDAASANETAFDWSQDLAEAEINDIAPAPDGGVYITGEIGGEIVVARYGPTGTLLWQETIDADGERGRITVAPDGTSAVGASGDPATVTDLSGAGDIEWSAFGIDVSSISAVASSPRGDLYVAGSYANPDDDRFPPGQITVLTAFDPDGNEVWNVELDDGSGLNFIVSDVIVLNDGRIVVAVSLRNRIGGLPGGSLLYVFDTGAT